MSAIKNTLLNSREYFDSMIDADYLYQLNQEKLKSQQIEDYKKSINPKAKNK